MKYTDKLGLKKPDLTDYVNVGDLNDNMDILDGEVGSLKEGTTEVVDLETLDKTYKGAINEINQEVKSHKAENATIKHKAKEIGLEDTSNNFTTVNVEGAMNELFISVNNGKNSVRGAIVGKGTSVPTNPTFAQLTSGVNAINTGKKWTSGVYKVPNNSFPARSSQRIFGLGFVPSTIVLSLVSIYGGTLSYASTGLVLSNGQWASYASSGTLVPSGIGDGDTKPTKQEFYIRENKGHDYNFATEVRWIAYE